MTATRSPTASSASTPARRVSQRRRSDRRRSVQATDESIAARMRGRQFTAAMRAQPYTAGASLLNLLVIGLATPQSVSNLALLGWMVALLLVNGALLQRWQVWRKGTKQAVASAADLRRQALLAGGQGALWGVVPLLMLDQVTPLTQTLVLLSLASMLCVAALGLAAVPRAAAAFLLPLVAGSVAALLLSPQMVNAVGTLQWVALSAMALTLSRTITKSLQARVSAEVKAEQQNQLIGLLLRDFSEQGSDVIWEIDAAGRLRHVTRQLANALGLETAELEGKSLMNILGEMQKSMSDSEREATLTLHERLTEGHPFRDVQVCLRVQDQQRWWSLTAKPLVDERGRPLGWRGVARDVTQARMADRKLAWLAHFDTLTGLTNRAHFRVLLEKALQHTRRYGGGGAVMCLDLDGFKNVNDTLGHATGDVLLTEVGKRLREAVGNGRSDVVARLGGDEFAVLLRTATTEADVAAVAQSILDAMRQPCITQGAEIPVRASIGIARFPEDGLSVDEMMQHADLALYDAKAHATGSLRFFAQRMGEQVRRRLILERDLREALERKQLHLYFQPKVDLTTWRVLGFEALLRWTHPEHGEIPPAEFIPVAEEAGLILAIGEWALLEACVHAARWPDDLQVAVNISPVQVMAQNLPDSVQSALRVSGLPAHRLELEITESVFINESRGTVGRLHALRRLGVSIALDDFGTGYSSLAYLRRFPFDTLKIDRAFVRELLVSRDARAIVRNILALAKALRMTTVAEGVEEPAQVKVLEAEGCDIVQGFYVAKPLPANEVLHFAMTWTGRDRPALPRDFSLGQTQTADLATMMPATVI
ncbi:MAG TPA: EAL domain-containing protein [Burkholderiaceae bacterium]|nr:EAL domain-containing protein [Burkholderiaceae bacterium]HMX10220.1 EAL domain-containing protein [Burkholderiaceae bacterium]HMZ00261.1 EAL domain-containing protein [Burkholderiaceae bacterium]HNB44770.1 EAL domain-containing protein [Burkholderiaceae bacterium]HNG80871.1 EAL domain-containing protein [Burkholderiaceae bacterium]